MYYMQSDADLAARLLQENLREPLDPGSEPDCGHAYEPTPNHADIAARGGEVWTDFDVHTSVYDEERPDNTVMRIVARVEYDDWVRMTSQEWTHQESDVSAMGEGMCENLCGLLRHSGPLKHKDGNAKWFMGVGGWVGFYEVAEFTNITPEQLFWEV